MRTECVARSGKGVLAGKSHNKEHKETFYYEMKTNDCNNNNIQKSAQDITPTTTEL